MRIRLGIRSALVKTYPLSMFNISEEEANKNNRIPFVYVDVLNIYYNNPIDPPHVEKRVKYFHIFYIPVFSLGIKWAIRNKYGLFEAQFTNQKKINEVFPKSRSPLYTYLAPILLLIFGIIFFGSNYLRKISYRHQAEMEVEAKKEKLIHQLDSLSPPYFLFFNYAPYSKFYFKRVDSVKDKLFYITGLPEKQLEKLKKKYKNKLGKEELTYYLFKDFNRLKKKYTHEILSRDSIESCIIKKRRVVYRLDKLYLRKIIPVEELLYPHIKFEFLSNKIKLKNTGKPVTLHSFEADNDLWKLKNETQFFDTGDKIVIKFYKPDHSQKNMHLNFVFTDESDIYEYRINLDYLDKLFFKGFDNIKISKN